MATDEAIARAAVDEDVDLLGLNVGERVEVVERILDKVRTALPGIASVRRRRDPALGVSPFRRTQELRSIRRAPPCRRSVEAADAPDWGHGEEARLVLRLSDMDSASAASRAPGRPCEESRRSPPRPCSPRPSRTAGRLDDAAKRSPSTAFTEGKSLHDLFCDWIWSLLTDPRQEATARKTCTARSAQPRVAGCCIEPGKDSSPWTVAEQRVQLTAEMVRAPFVRAASRTVPRRSSKTTRNIPSSWIPCGSGGRMRRGDPVDGTPSRLGPPYRLRRHAAKPTTGRSANAAWPYYCVHCAPSTRRLPMEWGGHPLWVTDYQAECGQALRLALLQKRRGTFPNTITRAPGTTNRHPGTVNTEPIPARHSNAPDPAYYSPKSVSTATIAAAASSRLICATPVWK